MRKILFLLLCIPYFTKAQNNVFRYQEFLALLKMNHPLIKQANLKITEAQLQLLQSRGAFDPKLEFDFDQKDFKDKNYYTFWNGHFKIPTWYGIELKASFDQADGIYVNPENTTPQNGLKGLGISVPIGQDLWINQRMADLKKAKLSIQLNQAQRELQALEIMFEASTCYFNWKQAHDELTLYQSYLKNALVRSQNVAKLIEQGDKPAIDSVEAGIVVRNRRLNLEEAQLKLFKSRLELSNYLWTSNNIPLELEETVVPEENLKNTLEEIVSTYKNNTFDIDNHPKINALNTKTSLLKIDQKLKVNALLPKISFNYTYLSDTFTFETDPLKNYKMAVQFAMPLFLRKERAALKLNSLKLQDNEFTLQLERLNLQNKLKSVQEEIYSLGRQLDLTKKLAMDYEAMLKAEEQLFSSGESSLFLMNTRENALVSSKITQISTENKFFKAMIQFHRTLGKSEL